MKDEQVAVIGAGHSPRRVLAEAMVNNVAPPEVPAQPDTPEVPDFQGFHDEMRTLNRRGFRLTNLPETGYVRPKAPGEIKGKKARRAAKRERARALKAAQRGEV